MNLFRKKTDRQAAIFHITQAIRHLREVKGVSGVIQDACINDLQVVRLILVNHLDREKLWRITHELKTLADSVKLISEYARGKALEIQRMQQVELERKAAELDLEKSAIDKSIGGGGESDGR